MKQTKHSKKSEAQNLCSKCPPFTQTHAFKRLCHCAIADGFGDSVQSWCYAAAILGTMGLHITVKGHQRANAILRCFETRDRDLLVRAFVTYVRTLMEYNSVVWSPDLKRDIDAIEKVQRRLQKGSLD